MLELVETVEDNSINSKFSSPLKNKLIDDFFSVSAKYYKGISDVIK